MQSKSKKKQQIGITALYCRLSRDDGTDNDSNSIINQKKLLQKYAKERLAKEENGRWRLTPKGFMVSNSIILQLLEAQQQSKPLAKIR